MSRARHRRPRWSRRRRLTACAIVVAILVASAVFVRTGPDWARPGRWLPAQPLPEAGTLCRGLESSLGTLPPGMDLEVLRTAAGEVTVRAPQVERLTATAEPSGYRLALCGPDEPLPPLRSCTLSGAPDAPAAEPVFPLFVAFEWEARSYGARPAAGLASAPADRVDCRPPASAVALDPDAPPLPPLCVALGGDVEHGNRPRAGSIAAGATVAVGASHEVTLLGRSAEVVDVEPVDAEISVDDRRASGTALHTTHAVIARALRCDPNQEEENQ